MNLSSYIFINLCFLLVFYSIPFLLFLLFVFIHLHLIFKLFLTCLMLLLFFFNDFLFMSPSLQPVDKCLIFGIFLPHVVHVLLFFILTLCALYRVIYVLSFVFNIILIYIHSEHVSKDIPVFILCIFINIICIWIYSWNFTWFPTGGKVNNLFAPILPIVQIDPFNLVRNFFACIHFICSPIPIEILINFWIIYISFLIQLNTLLVVILATIITFVFISTTCKIECSSVKSWYSSYSCLTSFN